MDGSAKQPPSEAHQQPGYPPPPLPPLPASMEMDPYHHHHAGAAAAVAGPASQVPHHAHQQVVHGYTGMHHNHAPPDLLMGGGGDVGGGSAMSALTAAAAAAQPTAPSSLPLMTSQIMSTVPNSMPSSLGHPVLGGGVQQHRPSQTSILLSAASANAQLQQQQLPVSQPQVGIQSPLGKVVESGHEHTGRWTKEEHEAFLAALQLYGKEWKKVAARVKTRTVVQTRTHAQKYFQKLHKVLEGGGGEKEANAVMGMVGGAGITLGGSSPNASLVAMMDLGIPPSNEKKSPKKRVSRMPLTSSSQKQKQQYQPPSIPIPNPMVTGQSAAISRSNSATAAALLNMSNDRRLSATLGPPSTMPAGAYSSVTHSVPSVPSAPLHQQHGFTTTANATVADASPASAHGFGYTVTAASTATGANIAKPIITGGISIVAPTHEDMMTAGKFPEPSPAACGKRKLAEIAAAQMLAGVARNSSLIASSGGPSLKKRASISGTAANTAPSANVAEQGTTSFTGLAAVGEDSRPTPTLPPTAEDSTVQMPVAADDESMAERRMSLQIDPDNLFDQVVNPDNLFDQLQILNPDNLFDQGNGSLQIVNPDNLFDPDPGHGLLQIVNPDNFVDQGNGNAKRRLLNGQASPSTPWDGQLEALVSQVKCQELPPQDPIAANSMTATDEAETSNQAEVMTVSKTNLLPLPLRSPRSTLQSAVCNGSVIEVSQICSSLTASTSPVNNERDDAGFYPLHSAAALGLLEQFGPNCQEALEICQLLIGSGADVMCRDKDGNTPVHWAARAGHSEVLGLLLLKSCPLDAQNDAGETALHWAMRAGDRGASAVKVLVENGARVNVFNRNFRRPLDVAAEGFVGLQEGAEGDSSTNNDLLVSDTTVDQLDRRSTRWNLMRFSSQCRTLVLHHQECLDHLAKSEHDWEVPDRIENIMSTLASRTTESCDPGDEQSFRPYEVTISNDFERATLELLSRIHSAEYLSFVNDLSKELDRKRKQQLIEDAQSNSPRSGDGPEKPMAVIPFTPMVQSKMMKEVKTKEYSNSDTAFSAGSLKAARRAAGAVQHAVDCVLVGRNRNAFCIVRPPGHHAGISGLLSDAESCGFCLFNNVAAGAMHALSDESHRPRVERCAIVDIDAHHGNGTEEIVRKCHDSGRLLFFSVHIYDHDKPKKGSDFQYKFYPGTGAEDDVAHNVINVPIAPLWREKEVVKSISLASNGGTTTTELRQTRQRSKEGAGRRVPSLPDLSKYNNAEPISAASLKSTSAASAESVSVASDSSQSSKPRALPSASPHYPPHYLMGTGRLAYRRAIQHRLLPALRAFNPDLIILSTGFDAARGDVGNARHYVNGTEAMGLDLEPEDYAWSARKVCEVADICCNGRVVSVLEGGYGRTPPPIPAPPLSGDGRATEPVRQKLDKSFFSECAIQHLKGLVDPYYAEDEKQKDISNRKCP
mmetsp:Transcript_21228/g.46056  ORF Transcript_21228/g.46056 Transcript_21228/m.46056 type:complete len:1444 (+) Transcript_21228:445-4776(+)